MNEWVLRVFSIGIGSVLTLYISYSFFSSYLQKHSNFGVTDYVLYAAIAVVSTISVALFENLAILTLIGVLTHMTMAMYSFEGPTNLKIVSAIVIVALGIFSEIFSAVALMFFDTGKIVNFHSSINTIISGIFLSKTLMIIIVKTATRKRILKVSHVSNKYIWMMLSIPAACFLLMVKLAYESILKERVDFSAFLSMLGILYIAVIFFVILEEAIHKTEENKLMQLEKTFYDMEKKHYQVMLGQREEVNHMIHDMKNMMLSVEMHLNAQDVEGAIEIVRALRHDVDGGNVIKTGNRQIDILINSKRERMVSLGIELETDVRIGELLTLDSVEMCVLLGNALDNAIESCERCQGDHRKIFMKMQTLNEHLAIAIKNSANPKCIRYQNGEWLSSKRGEKTGFGIKSMKRVVEDFGGNLIPELAKDWFTLDIVIPIEKIKA